jgi:hypothetical protein
LSWVFVQPKPLCGAGQGARDRNDRFRHVGFGMLSGQHAEPPVYGEGVRHAAQTNLKGSAESRRPTNTMVWFSRAW